MADIQARHYVTWACWFCGSPLDVGEEHGRFSCGRCGKCNAIPEIAIVGPPSRVCDTCGLDEGWYKFNESTLVLDPSHPHQWTERTG